jgi:hypothetical protein
MEISLVDEDADSGYTYRRGSNKRHASYSDDPVEDDESYGYSGYKGSFTTYKAGGGGGFVSALTASKASSSSSSWGFKTAGGKDIEEEAEKRAYLFGR